jgi:predicted DNA-binding protein (UPF0251 family)
VQNPATKTGHKWIEPDGGDFAETAKYYNAAKLLDSAPHEVYVSANITAEQLKVWMKVCITALQNYPKSVTPRFSFSALQEVSPFVSQEYSEVLELDVLGSGEAEASENQGSLINLAEAALQQELLSLKPDQEEILLLYYGLGINQKEIADKFAVTQSAIAYRLQTIERKFVKAVYALKQPPQKPIALWGQPSTPVRLRGGCGSIKQGCPQRSERRTRPRNGLHSMWKIGWIVITKLLYTQI